MMTTTRMTTTRMMTRTSEPSFGYFLSSE
jgi:hypothetical protein